LSFADRCFRRGWDVPPEQHLFIVWLPNSVPYSFLLDLHLVPLSSPLLFTWPHRAAFVSFEVPFRVTREEYHSDDGPFAFVRLPQLFLSPFCFCATPLLLGDDLPAVASLWSSVRWRRIGRPLLNQLSSFPPPFPGPWVAETHNFGPFVRIFPGC